MKKVLLAVLFLLLLGGAGAGYLWWKGQKDKEAADEASKAPPPLPEPPVFLKLERFVVPIVRQGFVDGFSRIELTLEVKDVEARIAVERAMPRIRDAVQTDLHAYIPLRRNPASGTVTDIDALRARISRVIEGVVGPDKVKAVLIEEAIDVGPKTPAKPPG